MPESFGEILRERRKAHDFTQKQLADRLSEACGYTVGESTICRWEKGRNKAPVPIEAVEQLEEILSVPEGVLQGAAGYAIPEASSLSKARAEHFDRLVEIVAELLVDGVGTVTREEPDVLPGQQLPENWAMAESWIKLHGRWRPLLYRREVSEFLNQKWEFMQYHYKKSELSGLMCHVAAEFTGATPRAGPFKYLGLFEALSSKSPYELIEKLIDLTNTKAFKGTCPDCPH